MNLTRDQEQRLDDLLKIYTRFKQDDETPCTYRRYIIHNIYWSARGLGTNNYILNDDCIPNSQCRELLFKGISTILCPDARDWQVYPLTGSKIITDRSIRKVYSWISLAEELEYRIFPEEWMKITEQMWRERSPRIFKKPIVKWCMVTLPLIDERSQTPDTEDDDK